MGSFDQEPSVVVVRAATLDDTRQIRDLGVRVFSDTFGHSVQPHQLQSYLDEAYTLPAIAADISRGDKDMIVATSSADLDEIIGFALLTRSSSEPCVSHLSDTVELQRIYVRADAHGKGIGRLLANRLEEMARQQGFRHMWLGVWEENLKAMKVYEKLGYKKVGEHQFLVGDESQTDHIMVKEL